VLPGSQSSSGIGALWGQNTAFPQFQGQVIFEKDLYGKAAFAGRPRGFVADFGAGVQRITYLGGQLQGAATFGQNGYQALNTGALNAIGAVQKNTQTLTPWVVQGTLFIPILVTHNNNLAGTASLTLQGHIGQGFSFFGDGSDADNSFFKYDSLSALWFSGGVGGVNAFTAFTPVLNYRRHLTPKYGGYIQGQYYFTNEWYASVVYGFDKSFGVGQDRNAFLAATGFPAANYNNPNGYVYATMTDQSSFTQELSATLFFTPSKNLKFGLSYGYLQTQYFQITQIGSNQTRTGDCHTVRFGGWFFF
jgi:hypothetical protein